jgi:ClpP class serine protease
MKSEHLKHLIFQPLAISQSYSDILRSPIAASHTLPTATTAQEPVSTESNVKVVKVFDGLAAKYNGWDTSYEALTIQINHAIKMGAEKIVLYIDSPGGEVAGLFGFAEYIHSLSSKYGIETLAVTDGSATSAAYVIASACNEIYATSSSILASIGVIMTLANVSKAEKEAGIEYTILRSKDEKALNNPHEATSDKVISDSMVILKTLDNIMNTTVNKMRPKVSLETIDNLKGNIVLAEEALSLGLIDKIVSSFDEALTISLTAPATTSSLTTIKGTTSMAITLEEALTQLHATRTELETLKASTSLEVAKAKQTEQARVLGILEAASTFSLSPDLAVKRIKASSSIEDAVEMFESIKEALQAANPVDTTSAAATHTKPAPVAQAKEEESFLTSFMKGVDTITAADSLFKGVK